MYLLFNMLSRLVITFLPRSKCLLISRLQLLSAVILEPPKNKIWPCFPIYFPWSDGTRFLCTSSVQFSCSIMSDSLWPRELQHTRPPCPSQLPEFTQTHVRRIGDAIQPSHPLSSPSPPAPNPSQHQSLFQWVNSSHEVAKILEFQLQHQSFQWTPRTDLL